MIKKAYYYLFYKFYKFSEAAPSRWLSDWKAGLLMDVLWIFVFFSTLNYYTVFTKQAVSFGNGKFAALLGIIFICIPNYFIFHHQNQWKGIVHQFDNLPKGTNRMGSWLVLCIVIFFIANFIFSFYLMSRHVVR